MSLFGSVRSACAEVASRAASVRIDAGALARLARRFAEEGVPRASPDPAHQPLGDDRATLAFVLTLDSINFGSGWFPLLLKRPGLSGYRSLATCWRRHCEGRGVPEPAELRRLEAADCARIFGQQEAPPAIAELMALFARALRDLGEWLRARHAGRFEGPIERAGGRAEGLALQLIEMPLFRDVAHYAGLRVPFYKRAQLCAADLAAAFEGRGWGRFEDLAELTIFADNLVPHVLRCEGVLVYAPELARRIDAGELLPPGSPEEVEIRALAVEAVERCVAQLRQQGAVGASAARLDYALWNRGQAPEIKARPRHRTRCAWY